MIFAARSFARPKLWPQHAARIEVAYCGRLHEGPSRQSFDDEIPFAWIFVVAAGALMMLGAGPLLA
jgi:hypothetical protein